MPGDNCSIYGCTVSRRSKYKGIAIFKVPAPKTEFEKSWKDKLVAVITKDREIDVPLRERIKSGRLFICQRHFTEDQILRHDTRVTLKPGVMPTLNLPVKSFPPSSSKPRESAGNIFEKKSLCNEARCETPTMCYKTFMEFLNRVKLLKLVGWEVSTTDKTANFKFNDGIHSVPKYEIHVDEHLSFIIRVMLWTIPSNHQIYSAYGSSLKNITVSNLIKYLLELNICPGLPNNYAGSCIDHSVPRNFNITKYNQSLPSPLLQSKWARSPSCIVLINSSLIKCGSCSVAETKESLSLKRKRDNLILPAKLKAPISLTSHERIKLTLQNYRLENKRLKSEMEQMQKDIQDQSLPVNNNLEKDLISIMSNANSKDVPPFMKLFWEEQQKYLCSSSKTSVRYHPMIIRYCLGLAAKSPAVYDEIRYDEKTNSGFVILPSRRCLRDYKNYIRPQQGFNKDVINELKHIVSNFSNIERYVILLMDEMKVQENLVWDKHTGDLIGFVDLGDPDLNYATFQKSDAIASHILVFLVRSIINPLKFSLANFATSNATSVQMFPLFWKAVGILEENCKLKVVGVTSDGASANRSMYRMHLNMTREEDVNVDVDVVYRTLNDLADEKRYIYFISDPPHLIKTARNCLANSLAGRCTRSMWNDGQYLTWNHISKLFNDDLDCGLHLVPKITNEHIKLSPFSVMNVRLAAQVLSESVYQALHMYGPPDAAATSIYCRMLDKFFDCLNVRNTKEATIKCKPFLKPYTSCVDERFIWLTDTLLKYFSDWKDSTITRPGQFTDNARAKMFISWQTYEGIKITTHSSIELIKFLLNAGCPYVLTERFCQDPLENYFGRQRSMGQRKDNPSVRDFGYNDNTIRTQKIFRPIAGNCRNDDQTLNKIDVETVPCRKRR